LSEFSSEFKFNFYIDQNFKENIVLKNKEFELHSLSNGYNLRLTFSIMFAFLRLVQERSGIDTNILVLDEALDSALDSEGRQELLEIIKKDFSEKSIFVISHNDEIKNQNFDKMYVVENNGFSSLKEM
jgi:energy-coupling factor transporter ATP-binding protein EcfA2